MSTDQIGRLEGELAEIKSLISGSGAPRNEGRLRSAMNLHDPPAPMTHSETDAAASIAAFDQLYGDEVKSMTEESSLHLAGDTD